MKIAVLHDYFTQLGGAERVAEELYRLTPEADLISLVALANKTPASLSHADIRTSWMQKMPGMEKYFRFYFLLYPFAARSLNLSGYDLVLSSSSGYAKGVRTGRDTLHVCYCHTPMRWAWSFDEYSARERMGIGQKIILPAFIAMLRNWDEFASCQPDHFIANSRAVAARIARVYGRAAEVIHPPVDVDRFRPSKEKGDYYLVLSRLVSYKRLDLAVQACTLLKRKLIVIGEGTCLRQLKELAGPTVHFVGRLPDLDVEKLVARCRALIFPGEEDFGLAPLEVAAAGRPCIAYRAGGALETIVDGVTGMFFEKQTAEDLADCIEHFETCDWSPLALQSHAASFRREVFQDRMRRFLERAGCPVPDASEHVNGLNVALDSEKDQICA
jgi:glycosyltransferase involved in cell wall biosynthesis